MSSQAAVPQSAPVISQSAGKPNLDLMIQYIRELQDVIAEDKVQIVDGEEVWAITDDQKEKLAVLMQIGEKFDIDN